MVFEKKDVTEKMVSFSSTLKPEAYVRLKQESERRGIPMSHILSGLIIKHLPREPMWEAVITLIRGEK